MQGPRPSRLSRENMASNSMDEKVAEAVRRFPILYNKSLKDLRDRNKKKNAWAEVARLAGLSTGI